MNEATKEAAPLPVRSNVGLGVWLPIDEHCGAEKCFIARFIIGEPEYVLCGYRQNGVWFLPYDSESTVDGTPMLGDNEQPTHYAPLFNAPNVQIEGLRAFAQSSSNAGLGWVLITTRCKNETEYIHEKR